MRTTWLVRIALFLLVLFAARPAHAQRGERRGFVGLGIGPSTPFGSFAKAGAIDPEGGHAVPGYTSTFLNLGWRFRPRWGVAAAFSYSEYEMRGGDDDDWWQVAGLTAGPMYSHPLGERGALDLKGMVGLLALTPVINSFTTGHGTGGGLGVDLRAAVRYDVFPRWAIFAEGGVQASRASFDAGTRRGFGAITSGLGIAFRPRW